MRKRPQGLQRLVVSAPFESAVASAIARISAADTTRRAYRRDFDLWKDFCGEYGVDVAAPSEESPTAFVEWMRRGGEKSAPTTRARRMSSLSSIYRELRRMKKIEGPNVFSVDDGPRREKVAVLEPTPIATADVVRRVIGTCDSTLLGVRDEAIVRVLWSTGMRRISLLSMTWERLARDPAGYVATVIKKGGETQRVLITRSTLRVFQKWLDMLRTSNFTSGEIWREEDGSKLVDRELNRALERRAKAVGAQLSPHMLRVAFLTYNPSSLENKQDAAGHADPATTLLYDREAWRGREAFEQMPEPEELT